MLIDFLRDRLRTLHESTDRCLENGFDAGCGREEMQALGDLTPGLIVLPVYSALASASCGVKDHEDVLNDRLDIDQIYRLKEQQDSAVKVGPRMCLSSLRNNSRS